MDLLLARPLGACFAMVRTSCFRGEAEQLARDGMQSGCITETMLQQVLSNLSVPLSKSRKRARPEHSQSVAKMVFGLYVMGGTCALTKATKEYPEVTRLLAVPSLKAFREAASRGLCAAGEAELPLHHHPGAAPRVRRRVGR